MAVVQESIQHRAGDDLVSTEDCAPFPEGLVGRQNDGAVLVEPTNELEEEIRVPRIHREISEFIEDQEVQAPERRQARAQGVIDGGSDELVEELRDGPKQHALVRTARTDADGDRQVTFPGTGRPDQDQVFGAREEPEFGEFADERCRSAQRDEPITRKSLCRNGLRLVDPFAKNSNRRGTPLRGRSSRRRGRPSLSAHRCEGASPPATRARTCGYRAQAQDRPQDGGQVIGLAGEAKACSVVRCGGANTEHVY